MKNLLYYPGFEVRDTTWLKFALLYLDELRPIIPDNPFREEHYLSDDARRVKNDTDLIHPYQPKYEEGAAASLMACDEFEKYLRNPERYG